MKKNNKYLLGISLLLLILCLLLKNLYYVSYISIITIDLYLILVLFSAAILSDKKALAGNRTISCAANFLLPSKTIGLLIFGCILITVLYSFSTLYLDLESGMFNKSIQTRGNSLYFSFVTITTLGYGDIYPIRACAKLLVMSELASGVLILSGGFGLLLSRLSNID